MRIPEPRPFGETSLRAIVLAIWAADPLKVRGGGWVESVVTRLTQRFVERFFAIRSRVQRQLKCVAVVLIDLRRFSRVLIRFVLCQVVANVVEILVDVREALLFALGAGIAHRLRIDRLDVVDLLRWPNASTDSERSAGRRWPSAWRTPRDDRDRLLQCTDLQCDGLIPIPRLTQFELVAKRAESAERCGEDIAARTDRRELKTSGRIGRRLRFDLLGIFQCQVDPRQHGAAR